MMKKRCWNCANEEDGTGCADCFAGETPSNWKPSQNYVPPTNADHFRSLSDEEMAEYLSAAYFQGMLDAMETPPKVERHKYTLNWIRQPWEEDA